MNDNFAIFLLAMVNSIAVAVLILTWLRGRQRMAELRAVAGQKAEANREIEVLSGENAGLRHDVGRLKERIAVLETIATDPAGRTAREIENLR